MCAFCWFLFNVVFAACLRITSTICFGGVLAMEVQLLILLAISSPYLVPTYWMTFLRVILIRSADVRCPISKKLPSSTAHSPFCALFVVVDEDWQVLLLLHPLPPRFLALQAELPLPQPAMFLCWQEPNVAN